MRSMGTELGVTSEAIIALSGLLALAAAAFTGALWGSPVLVALFRWLAN